MEEIDDHLCPESRSTSEKANEIIKENSEILDKILRKKSLDETKSLPPYGTEALDDTKPNVTMRCSTAYDQGVGSSTMNQPASKTLTFNPFPNRVRRPREVGLKLGLYSNK